MNLNGCDFILQCYNILRNLSAGLHHLLLVSGESVSSNWDWQDCEQVNVNEQHCQFGVHIHNQSRHRMNQGRQYLQRIMHLQKCDVVIEDSLNLNILFWHFCKLQWNIISLMYSFFLKTVISPIKNKSFYFKEASFTCFSHTYIDIWK